MDCDLRVTGNDNLGAWTGGSDFVEEVEADSDVGCWDASRRQVADKSGSIGNALSVNQRGTDSCLQLIGGLRAWLVTLCVAISHYLLAVSKQQDIPCCRPEWNHGHTRR